MHRRQNRIKAVTKANAVLLWHVKGASMKRIASLFLAVLMILVAIPAHAATPAQKPVIVTIGGQQAVTATSTEQGPNKFYLPFIANPKCYALNPLQPGAASVDACASLAAFTGSQSLAGYVQTITNGAPQV